MAVGEQVYDDSILSRPWTCLPTEVLNLKFEFRKEGIFLGISTNEAVNTALKRDYRKTKARFLRKGLMFAFASGISYGLFSAF